MNLTIEKKRNRVFDYCAKTGCAWWDRYEEPNADAVEKLVKRVIK